MAVYREICRLLDVNLFMNALPALSGLPKFCVRTGLDRGKVATNNNLGEHDND
jgi:hypothetical protein